MKNLLMLVTCALLVTSSLSVNAKNDREKAGPPDNAGPPAHAGAPDHAGPSEHAGKPEKSVSCDADDEKPVLKPKKVRIAHCGCSSDGTDLVWKQIRVSTKAKGHLKHMPYSDENPRTVECGAMNSVEEVAIEHKRAVSDCVIPGEKNNIGAEGGLAACGEDIYTLLGQSCSQEGPQEAPEQEQETAEPEEEA